MSLYLFRSIESVFRSIKTHESGFKKNQIWLVQTAFSKLFKTFFLSLRLGKAPQRFFCRFPPNFLQGFSLPKPICLFYPSFCIVCHALCIFSWFLGTIFRLCIFWNFWWIKPCFVKLINGFCCHNDIFLIYDG